MIKLKKTSSYIRNLELIKINKDFHQNFDFLNQNINCDENTNKNNDLEYVKVPIFKGKR